MSPERNHDPAEQGSHGEKDRPADDTKPDLDPNFKRGERMQGEREQPDADRDRSER